MLEHIYASVNNALGLVWTAIAPAAPAMVLGLPDRPQAYPAESFRVYWLSYGGETDRVDEVRSIVQLDVFVPQRNVTLALERAQAIADKLGFTQAPGYGRLGIYDETGAEPVIVGEARIASLDDGWVNVPDPVPGIVHLSRVVEILTTAYLTPVPAPRVNYLLLEDGTPIAL